MNRIYLDNNASTVVDPKGEAGAGAVLAPAYGNPNSLHSFGTDPHLRMGVALDRIYKGIGAADDDVVVINDCASEGNNTVLKGVWLYHILNDDKSRIVTSQVEHPVWATRWTGSKLGELSLFVWPRTPTDWLHPSGSPRVLSRRRRLW